MEDLGKYSYLIFLLIYLIYNFFTKSKDVAKKQNPPAEVPEGQSFEDVLREMMGGQPSSKTKKSKAPELKKEEKVIYQPLAIKNTGASVRTTSLTHQQSEIDALHSYDLSSEEVELHHHHQIIDEIHSGKVDYRKAIILSEILQRPRYV
jgi:hypothetical protein